MFDAIPVHDEFARALAIAVRDLDIEYRAMRNRVVERAGISVAELDALAAVASTTRVTPKHLARATNLTTSATTALLDRLSALGLARRVPHPTDRRSVIVALTPSGEALISEAFQRYVSKFETLLAEHACDGSQVAAMITALRCFTGALASDDGEYADAISA